MAKIRTKEENKKFMINWKKKKVEDYEAKDLKLYFQDRFYKMFKFPCSSQPVYFNVHWKRLMGIYSAEQITKAIRWWFRERNYGVLLTSSSFSGLPNWKNFIGFADTIFEMALQGKNMDDRKKETGSSNKKSIKNTKIKKKSKKGWD